jgi:hypothetical protein
MTTYTPATLPPLPRKRCPGIWQRTVTRYGSKQDMYIVPAPCTGKPLKNGWCTLHQHSFELLEKGAQLGYPRMQINIGLWIGSGVGNWEGYAQHYLHRRREQVLHAIGRWKAARLLEEEGRERYTGMPLFR